ncbi:MAG: NAD(P)/FAD-dependent oxidoreductase [Anaerolineales bacterium]
MKVFPVVIIGAGPAGLTAAMQLERQSISPVVLERNQVGGLLLNANLVENYPGFVEGVSGPDLVKLFSRQAERLGVNVSLEEVFSVEIKSGIFHIVTNKREIKAGILVAASGTIAKTLHPDLFTGDLDDKVYTDVYPLIEEKGKTILIVGAGDAALDYALNLARLNQVIILNRGTRIKGLPLLWDRVQMRSAIDYFPNVEITGIAGTDDGRINVLAETGAQQNCYQCDFLISAIGRIPDWGFAEEKLLKKMDQLQEEGKIYVIGDLHNGPYRQTALAVGDGIRAAMEIGQSLEKEKL